MFSVVTTVDCHHHGLKSVPGYSVYASLKIDNTSDELLVGVGAAADGCAKDFTNIMKNMSSKQNCFFIFFQLNN